MPLEGLKHRAGGEIPQLERPIVAARQSALPIGQHRHRRHPVGVPLEGLKQRSTGRRQASENGTEPCVASLIERLTLDETFHRLVARPKQSPSQLAHERLWILRQDVRRQHERIADLAQRGMPHRRAEIREGRGQIESGEALEQPGGTREHLFELVVTPRVVQVIREVVPRVFGQLGKSGPDVPRGRTRPVRA